MKKIISLFIILVLFSFGKNTATTPIKFKVGQVWHYKTRLGEEASTLTILKVEHYKKEGTIVHIYIGGLHLKNPNTESGFSTEISHTPISQQALAESVTRLATKKEKLPDYKKGYDVWKKEFDTGNGGVFSIPVSETLTYTEEVLSQ